MDSRKFFRGKSLFLLQGNYMTSRNINANFMFSSNIRIVNRHIPNRHRHLYRPVKPWSCEYPRDYQTENYKLQSTAEIFEPKSLFSTCFYLPPQYG